MRPNGTPVIKRPRTTPTKADRTEGRIASGCTERVEMNDCNLNDIQKDWRIEGKNGA
jgi:hypothetical protein